MLLTRKYLLRMAYDMTRHEEKRSSAVAVVQVIACAKNAPFPRTNLSYRPVDSESHRANCSVQFVPSARSIGHYACRKDITPMPFACWSETQPEPIFNVQLGVYVAFRAMLDMTAHQ